MTATPKNGRVTNLTGALLLASPDLADSNFRRTVVFIVSHDASGSLGFILNRPTEQKVADVVTEVEPLGPLAAATVFIGGPVAENQLVVGLLETENAQVRMVFNQPVETVLARAADPNVVVRAFAGYSGWGKGQLEKELQQDSWIVRPAGPFILDPAGLKTYWRETVSAVSPWYRVLASAPDDPSVN